MFDIIALGELLVDFTQAGTSPNGMVLFERNPGGAIANVLVAAAKLGHSTAFLGKVGADMHGAFLAQTLQSVGVCTDGLIMDPDVFTTLAFVTLSAQGERAFSFARKPGADTQLRPDELNPDLIQNTRIFHIGSLSLTNEPARSATLRALELAKASGSIISYDPNYRSSLWPDQSTAIKQMRSVLPLVDLIKISDEEAQLITDTDDPVKAAKYLAASGIGCVAVTLGSKGVLVYVNQETVHLPAHCVPVVDTTGAGDAFWGGFLHGFLAWGKPLNEVSLTDARTFAQWGNAAAACCIQHRGAIPAMPTLEQAAVYLTHSGL